MIEKKNKKQKTKNELDCITQLTSFLQIFT